jgi:hypothetical protein
MEIRSGTGYTSYEVPFRKTYADGKWSYVSMQIPIPDVKLTVRNPNYDLIQAIVFLALTEEALTGVDNGGTFEETGRIVRPQDFYISFSPSLTDRIVKSTVTTDIKPQIVKLFQKYTIYQFLNIITGEDFTNVTVDNDLIKAVQDNLINIPVYAEAGFSNDSDSTLDNYFIRNKIITRFNFDRAYLDNPTLKPFILKATTDALQISFKCKNLKRIKFSVYSSPTNSFDFINDTPIKQVSLDVNRQTDPVFSITMASIGSPAFNNLTAFKTEVELDAVINSRKYFAVKITSVVVSSGIEKIESDFAEFFGLNKDTDTTKKVSLTYNVPTPSVATYIESLNFPKPPYFLNLVNNSRKFFFKIVVKTTGAIDPKNPAGISGFLIKYINNASTSSNTIRYYPLTSESVNLEVDGFVPRGTSEAWYYYSVTDFFKRPASPENTFKLDMPYANAIYVYAVDKYYYTSNSPLKLPNTVRYDLSNYFAQASNGFLGFDGKNQLTFNYKFLERIPRVTLPFKIEYTDALQAQTSPPAGAVWTTVPDTYTLSINHVYGNMLDHKALSVGVYKPGQPIPLANINLAYLFTRFTKGSKQGLWIRVTLLETYSTDKTLPYTGTTLALIKRTF